MSTIEESKTLVRLQADYRSTRAACEPLTG
jgi:hypothetical protein